MESFFKRTPALTSPEGGDVLSENYCNSIFGVGVLIEQGGAPENGRLARMKLRHIHVVASNP